MASQDRIDGLYDLDPEEFVAARDQLAKELRAEKDRDGARSVKALRRPTVTAWALNQFARRRRDEAEALVEAGQEAAAAQSRALSGRAEDKEALRAALRIRHDAVQRAVASTREILSERGSPATEPEIAEALTSASTDEEVARQLLEARLAQPPSASSGLGSLDSLLAASLVSTDAEPEPEPEEAEPEPEPDEEAEPEPESEPEDEDAEPEPEPDEGQLGDAAREAADRELEELRSAARKAQIRALEAEDEAADAAAAVRRAEAALRSARDDAEESTRRAARLREEAEDARRAVDEAESRPEG